MAGLGRAVTTQHAQVAVRVALNDKIDSRVNGSQCGEALKTKGRSASIDDYVARNKDGSRTVAPIVKDFMGELGAWLFTTDTGRWERQARITGQLTNLPRIEAHDVYAEVRAPDAYIGPSHRNLILALRLARGSLRDGPGDHAVH
eukprot:2848769-Rhodomonas_salina.3